MSSSSRIAILIHATLLSVVGCNDEGDEWGGAEYVCDDPEIVPIDVTDWNLSAERFVAMTSLLEDYGETWAEFDDQRRCEMACLHADDLLDDYLSETNDPESYSYYPSVAIELCSLTLIVEAETVIGGSVSCQAELVYPESCAVVGRRPLGWASHVSTAGSQMDQLATFEHVSIAAFLELAGQLEALRAPTPLIDRCRAAAADERRHVALLVELGATEPSERVTPIGLTSRTAIARHNAVEGCVNETWAALLAHWQAEHATEHATRLAFTTIADDETRHAQLAWDLHDWLIAGLDPSERAAVEAERLHALDRLAASATATALATPADVRRALGLPDPRQARALARDFAERLRQSTLASADQLALPAPGKVRPASSSSAS